MIRHSGPLGVRSPLFFLTPTTSTSSIEQGKDHFLLKALIHLEYTCRIETTHQITPSGPSGPSGENEGEEDEEDDDI